MLCFLKGVEIMKVFPSFFLFLFIICFSEKVSAQTPETLHNQSFSANALFIPFGTISAEYERIIHSPKTTLGFSGWYEYKDVKARWTYAKMMYYPGGIALSGFAFGLTAGVIRSYSDKDSEKEIEEHDTSPTVGAMIQYNWLPGSKDRLLIGFGLGSRCAVKSIGDNSPLKQFDGDGRIVVGWTF
jgi:hypothetical protein